MTYWHTTFGSIKIKEIVLEELGKTVRPFLAGAKVIPRKYSLQLQRRVVDFGADVPFNDVPKKLFEHYGIELCREGIRQVTLEHASNMESFMDNRIPTFSEGGVTQILGEADGGMVPIVIVDKKAKDKRKTGCNHKWW